MPADRNVTVRMTAEIGPNLRSLPTAEDTCPRSERIDGPWHSWEFDGDHWIRCLFCDAARKATTTTVVRTGRDSIPEPWEPVAQELRCPARDCHHTEWVSPEDPDASLSQMYSHIRWLHPRANADKALGRVKLVERRG